MTTSVEEMVERLSATRCAICGKDRNQHITGSGYPTCQMFPVFISERSVVERIVAALQPNTGEQA